MLNLDPIESRLGAATPGEWSVPHLSDDTCKCNCGHVLSEGYCGAIATLSVDNGLKFEDGGNDAPPLAEAKANGIFIAYAKNFDIPELIAEVRRLRGKFQDAIDWIRAANHFCWAHEEDCPRGNGGVDCICGLHDFVSRPRPIVEGFKQEIDRLRAQVDCANSFCCQTLDCAKEAEMVAPDGKTFCDDCWKSKVAK